MMKEQDVFEKAGSLDCTSAQLRTIDHDQKGPLESAVTIEFETGAIPYAQANAGDFFKLMKEKLKAEIGDELRMILVQNNIDVSKYTLKQFDQLIPTRITFRDGIIEYDHKGKVTYVPLSHMVINSRGTLQVGAWGTTGDAEKGLAKVYECIFESAGMNQQWADSKGSLIARGYATTSVEQLDGSLSKLLSEGLHNFIVNDFSKSKEYASSIGILPLNQVSGMPLNRNYQAVVKLNELELDVIRFDPESGDRHNTTVSIRPKTTIDAGVARYRVTTQLEYSKHLKFIKKLKSVLNNGPTINKAINSDR